MDIIYKPSKKLEVHFSAGTNKEIFERLAGVEEVCSHSECGLCHSTELKFVVRTVSENDYFEIQCNQCSGKLSFGQHRQGGTIFPKKFVTDKDGNKSYSTGGWHRYIPEGEDGFLS